MSWNVAAPVAPPIRYSSQKERMRRIPLEISRYKPDVLIVQESMSRSQHQLLTEGLKAIGMSHSTDHITGNRIMPGGVVIFSGFPIENEHREVFESSIGTDALSAKGFVYGRVNGIHIIGFHLQAWPTAESKEVRKSQVRQMRAFIDGLPPHEGLILAGDLNVDYYSGRREFKALQEILGLRHSALREDSHEYTFDPATNALTGNDDDTFYASKRYPKGCYSEYVATMRCPCCPRELLDFFFYRNLGEFETRVVPMKTTLFQADININTKRWIMDLSDHYAILAEIPVRAAKSAVRYQGPPTDFSPWDLVPLLVIIILISAIVYVAISIGRRPRGGNRLPDGSKLDFDGGDFQKVLPPAD